MATSYMRLIVKEGKTAEIANYILNGLKEYGDLQISWTYNYLMIHTIVLKHDGKYVAKFALASFDCKRQKLSEEEMANKADIDVNAAKVKKLYFKAMASVFEGYAEERKNLTEMQIKRNTLKKNTTYEV